MIYRISLLSNAFTHLAKALNLRGSIIELFGHRTWLPRKPKRITEKEIPYVYYEEKTFKKVKIKKLGYISRPGHKKSFLDLKRTIEWLVRQEVPDLPISQIGIIIKGLVEREKEYLVILRHKPATEDYVRRDVMAIMRHHIDNLGFKIEVLDLFGIYELTDPHRTNNLLKDVWYDRKKMIEIADALFKPTIKINGNQTKIRSIRGYEMGTKDTFMLKEYEKI